MPFNNSIRFNIPINNRIITHKYRFCRVNIPNLGLYAQNNAIRIVALGIIRCNRAIVPLQVDTIGAIVHLNKFCCKHCQVII